MVQRTEFRVQATARAESPPPTVAGSGTEPFPSSLRVRRHSPQLRTAAQQLVATSRQAASRDEQSQEAAAARPSAALSPCPRRPGASMQHTPPLCPKALGRFRIALQVAV